MKKNDLAKLSIIATIFSIPLYLIKLSIFGFPINLLEILTILTIILFILSNNSFDPALPKIYYITIGMIIMGLFLSAWSGGNWKVSLGIIKGWFIFPMTFAYIISKYQKDARLKENIIYAYFLSAGLVSIISLVYAALGFLTYDHRLNGFYLSPNHLAMYLAPALIIGIYFLSVNFSSYYQETVCYPIKIIRYYLLAFVFSLILAALYLTFSYAAWISLFIAIFIGLLIKSGFLKNRKVLYLIIIALLVLVAQVQSPKLQNQFAERSSWQSRILIWKSGLKITADNPIWGVGPGNFQNKYLEYQKYFPPYLEWAVPQPHNLYLAFWLESGIIGLLGFLILVAFWLFKIIISTLRNKSESNIVLATIIIYILLHGLIDTPIWKNDLAFVFWIIIALGIKKSHHNGKIN
jgi:O-antigen ligase